VSVSHSYDPADGFPRIMPSLRYEDVGAALTWLGDAFGLEEHLRWTDEHGIVRHAEMRMGDAFVELSGGSKDHPTPKRLGGASGALVGLVDDVDAHFSHTRSRGADIVSEPEDRPWGLRQYTAPSSRWPSRSLLDPQSRRITGRPPSNPDITPDVPTM
jgi:uncharacterized glyoxalase superfamily protein PhnB